MVRRPCWAPSVGYHRSDTDPRPTFLGAGVVGCPPEGEAFSDPRVIETNGLTPSFLRAAEAPRKRPQAVPQRPRLLFSSKESVVPTGKPAFPTPPVNPTVRPAPPECHNSARLRALGLPPAGPQAVHAQDTQQEAEAPSVGFESFRRNQPGRSLRRFTSPAPFALRVSHPLSDLIPPGPCGFVSRHIRP